MGCFLKEYEDRGLRCIDERAFGRAVKTCFGLSNTVRQLDICLHIFSLLMFSLTDLSTAKNISVLN